MRSVALLVVVLAVALLYACGEVTPDDEPAVLEWVVSGDARREVCLEAGAYELMLSRAHQQKTSVALSENLPGGAFRVLAVARFEDGMDGVWNV